MRMMRKRLLSVVLVICLCLPLPACGGSAYGVKAAKTLVQQQYSLAFLNNDSTLSYGVEAVHVFAAKGKVNER